MLPGILVLILADPERLVEREASRPLRLDTRNTWSSVWLAARSITSRGDLAVLVIFWLQAPRRRWVPELGGLLRCAPFFL